MRLPRAAAVWAPAPVPAAAAALEAAGQPPRLAALLARRGVEDAEAARRFLEPCVDDLHDPGLLAGMEEAVERLLAARERGETVAIVGDYDVDGVSATALLVAVFSSAGIAVQPILPHRIRDGYGFRPVHVERAVELGVRLVVTVDCGTTSGAAVAAAAEAGIDVVVTDHHLPGEGVPTGAIVVNPRQEGCSYPFGDLCGAGLALKLALAFSAAAGRSVPLEALLRIACLGTIADLVPLLGENRVIAALGLEALARTRSQGLRALFRTARVSPPFAASDVGYRIAPRLNAAGRLDDAHRALDLLLTRDPSRAEKLARDLDAWNSERRQEEARAVDEAREILARRIDEAGGVVPRLAVAWSPSWHRGVVGIAAGRIARELHRPTLLLAVEEGRAVGSGRSIPGLPLHAFLSTWRERYVAFGGHAQAVGMTVEADRLPDLAAAWEEAATAWDESLLEPRHEYELDVAPAEVTPHLLAELARLEPHGQGNPKPLLHVGPLSATAPPRHFGKGHLSLAARGTDGYVVHLVGWRWGERAELFASPFEVLAHLEHDSYRGGPVLRLVDARAADG